MSHSQEGFSIHLAQALSYLHSRHHHLKTWAALFIGEQAGQAQGPPGPPGRTLTLSRPRPPRHSSRSLGSTGKREKVAGEGASGLGWQEWV